MGPQAATPARGPTVADVIAQRLSAQLLSGAPAHSPEEVVERLLAVQAQDPRGARLSVRSRSAALAAADVDAALSDRRSLVITWLNRGTLHLVTPQDYWWLHPLTTPQLATANRRRLDQEGVTPAQAERGVQVIVDTIAALGPQTRHQLRQHLDEAGIPTAGQALVHLLLAASLRAEVVRGPMRGAQHAFVDARQWLGHPPAPCSRDEGLARLARRYLAGHGPADAADLAKWAGITLGDSRRALDQITDELVVGAEGLVDLKEREPAAPLPPPRLLGAFDPLLLGWCSRTPFVGDYAVVTTNGLFRPCALVDGRVVATWALSGGALTVRLLEAVSSAVLQALRADGVELLRFLGLPGTNVAFTGPP